MSQHLSIRKQRKADTRQRLIDASQKLFKDKGYDATTLERVAADAGLHVQTLYRHFSNKVELAAAGEEAVLKAFRTAISDEQRTNTTIEFWRDFLVAKGTEAISYDEGRAYREILHEELQSSAISIYLIQLSHSYIDLLTEYLKHDLIIDDPQECTDIARLIAITLWGAHDDVMREYDRREDFDLIKTSNIMITRIEQLYHHLLKVPEGSSSSP